MPSDGQIKYDVFLSYSHRDGRTVARWLQHQLQSYRLPEQNINLKLGELASEAKNAGTTREQAAELRRPRRVIRDETDLTANPNLWEEIRDKLTASQFLIFIATPKSAGSEWVRKEVEEFLKLRPHNLLTALAAGSPETSFPAPLRENLKKGLEPLYADLRRPWQRSRWALWRWSVFAEERRDQLLKLLARLYGVDLNPLTRFDAIRQGIKRRRIVAGLSAILALLSLFLPPIHSTLERTITQWLNRHIPISSRSDPPAQSVLNGRALKGHLAELVQYHSTARPLRERLVIPEVVALSGGQFQMGSARWPDAQPMHQVEVQAFAIGRFEVTVAQYHAFCWQPGRSCPADPAPGYSDDPNVPAVFVAWDEAVAYTNWISELTGKTYRLPTEAEWEYAARAGSELEYGVSDSPAKLEDYAWFGKRSEGKPIQINRGYSVGLKQPNAWRLYDMLGNAYEWTNSLYKAYPHAATNGRGLWEGLDYRVIRGGSWYTLAEEFSVASRLRFHPGKRDGTVGFRVAMDIGR